MRRRIEICLSGGAGEYLETFRIDDTARYVVYAEEVE